MYRMRIIVIQLDKDVSLSGRDSDWLVFGVVHNNLCPF